MPDFEEHIFRFCFNHEVEGIIIAENGNSAIEKLQKYFCENTSEKIAVWPLVYDEKYEDDYPGIFLF